MNKFLVKNPIVTEKAIQLGKDRKYVFLVDRKSSASEIKKIVESNYKVQVIKTNVINIKGKPKHFRNYLGVQPGHKKVILTLKEGQKLDILPQ